MNAKYLFPVMFASTLIAACDAASPTDTAAESEIRVGWQTGLLRVTAAPACPSGCGYQTEFHRPLGSVAETLPVLGPTGAAVDFLKPGDLLPVAVEKNVAPGASGRVARLILSGTLVRINAEGVCGEYDPALIDGCKYQATILTDKSAGKPVELFINGTIAGDLRAGDLVDLRIKQINTPDYPTEYLGEFRTDKSLVRVETAGSCGEFDPIVVGDACAYSGRSLSGAAEGTSIPFFVSESTANYLKPGDLVSLKLSKISDSIDPINQEHYLEFPDEYMAKHN